MTDCIFCQIVRGEAAASVLYRDEDVLVFLDRQPVNAGHALVVPTHHAVGLADLDPHVGGRMFAVAQAIAAALRSADRACAGVNLFFADGAAAMQEVFHAHLHVFPRYENDGFGFRYDERHFVEQPRAALDVLAERLRPHLAFSPGTFGNV